MKKTYKYSLTALRAEHGETICEICFEAFGLIQESEEHTFLVNHEHIPFLITRVRKVNHVETPNDRFDYRLFGTAL